MPDMSKKLPTRQEDYSAWYNELVKRAGLAENSAVRGCMVIKPYGYAIWEKLQAELDRRFKATGFEYGYTSREAVIALGEHLRLHPLLRDAGEPYRYEREVEEFLRYSPSVRRGDG